VCVTVCVCVCVCVCACSGKSGPKDQAALQVLGYEERICWANCSCN